MSDEMKTIAIYNLKGGVGKSSMAVNLAAASAKLSARRTLLWDLDPQGAASYIAADKTLEPGVSLGIFQKTEKLAKTPKPSRLEGVDIITADSSLRDLDHYLAGSAGKRRLAKLLSALEGQYDRLILDCPPGLTDLSEQVLHAADIIIVPIIPSALSQRAFEEMVAHIRGNFKKQERVALLPVFSMVDKRRTRHAQALAENPDWPVIPMASVVENIAERRCSLFDFAPRSAAAQAYASLWRAAEHRLTMAK